MKYLLPALFLATLAFTSRTALAQGGHGTTDSVTGTEVTGRLSRPTPAPSATPGATKAEVTATLSTDEKGKSPMTTFSKSDAKIWLIAHDGGGMKGDKIRVVWTAEDTGKVFAKNKKLTEFTQTMTGPNQSSTYYLPSLTGGFPVGKYRADVYANDKLATNVKFTVK